MKNFPLLGYALPALLLTSLGLNAAPPDAAGVDFFEKKIRPVLVEQCYKCHSAEAVKEKKLKGALLLDSREGLLTGGDSGPSIVARKPQESLLIKALHGTDVSQMPPKGKLPAAVIADFEKWIELGAPDPRTASTVKKTTGMSIEAGRNFWSYKLPVEPPLPAVNDPAWAKNKIDRFILAALEAKGLRPAPDADRATLIRRLYFDLIGLPPTPGEVDAFLQDSDPRAYEKLVDRLLASPQFGERWGRHWLDIARYADSLTLRGFILKEAWRYRDYVIDAFNRDLPYDQFLREQIAGDLLPSQSLDDRRRKLIATSFLVLGNTNLEEQDKKTLRMDMVDEQLDVIGKGLLAQTISCTRCHDHKFDPITTKDYYALAGILRNTKALEHSNVSKWIEMPLPVEPALEAKLKKHESEVASLQARIKAEKAKSGAKTVAAKGILAVKDVAGIVVDDAQAKKVGAWQDSTHSGHYIGTGYVHDLNADKGEKSLSFDPDVPETAKYEVKLAYSPGTSRANNVPVTVFSADGEKTITVDMTQLPPLEGRFISLGVFRFEKGGQSFVIVSNEGTKGHVTADAITFTLAEQSEATGAGKPNTKTESDTVKKLEAELKKLQESGISRDMVMTVVEEKTIEDARVHIRGLVQNPGELVPRGFLQVATSKPISLPKDQSGRKELAEWIASSDNPLTARVMANRAWHWLLGSGIVRTTDNFGTTGELPSHPELLDHLAVQLMAEGWSMKKLVRSIVLSRTYQQSTSADAKALASDPENRLFGRANRRRLDAECIRDTMLQVSGKLSPERGGQTYPASTAADYGFKHTDSLRSVYSPIFRNSIPELLEVFDFADTSMVTGRRNVSTVAPQALFLMNHPFVLEQSRLVATRLLKEQPEDGARITYAYRLTLGRQPQPGELDVAKKFIQSKTNPADAYTGLIHALFSSADFRYVN